MKLEKVLIDTNLYIGWLNDGRHEHLMLNRGSFATSRQSFTWSSRLVQDVYQRAVYSISSHAPIAPAIV